MRFGLAAVVISLWYVIPVGAGEWSVSPQPGITRSVTPRNPMELKQPAILDGDKGTKVWYAGYWGGQGLCVADFDKGGISPRAAIRDCVFSGLDPSLLMSSPCVVQHEAGYRMWFTYSPTWPGPWKVGMASSLNGIEWESCQLNPLLEPTPEGDDSGAIQDVCVVKADQSWHMWYSCQKKDNWKVEIFHATSADGIEWKREGKVSFDVFYPGLVMEPWVVRKHDGYVMFYVTVQGDEKPCLRSATSRDGQNWKSGFLPPLENAWSPTVTPAGDGWRAWFIRDGGIWSADYKP